MGHYLSRFPKRHIAWSNSQAVGCLDMGTLCREVQKQMSRSGIKSAKTYNSGGRKRFVGTRHLKQSESGAWLSKNITVRMYRMVFAIFEVGLT